MLVPVITTGITLLELSEKFASLALGSKTNDATLKGKTVFAKRGVIRWFQSSLALTDTVTNVGSAPLGVLTGYIYKSKVNGALYYEVQLTREIESGYDASDTIWINFNDLEIYKPSAKSNNLFLLGLLGLLLLGQKK